MGDYPQYNYYKQDLLIALIPYYKDEFSLDQLVKLVNEITEQFIDT